MEKTLGGDRLGAGKKQKIELKNFERSTHDLSYVWRSSMSAGTLVPFLNEIALPGDTFDINLNTEILTLPTTGPLFGSFKVQLDVFQAPIRLYNRLLHNNTLGIGMNMSEIMLPTLNKYVHEFTATKKEEAKGNYDNIQVNPSALLSYMGIRGFGMVQEGEGDKLRSFNAVSVLAYHEIYKNYYANKQEEIGAVIHNEVIPIHKTVDYIQFVTLVPSPIIIPEAPGMNWASLESHFQIVVKMTSPTNTTRLEDIMVLNNDNQLFPIKDLAENWIYSYDTWTGEYIKTESTIIHNWRYKESNINGKPKVVTFDLKNIDLMREYLLMNGTKLVPVAIEDANLEPYTWLTGGNSEGKDNSLYSQEGLLIKTYQSDLLNNWLNTEWIDGTDGINAITKVSTADGGFQIDSLILARKVYDMLNQIAVSGGSYDDWLDAVYSHERYTKAESPIYHGGLIKELIFQEVVSNAATSTEPLGTLAGQGRLSSKHKGGTIRISVDEPSYIIGIISLTPRIDYSQGNKWDINLKTLDDLHKPALDQIGFQELIAEQAAWWTTYYNPTQERWIQQSMGKQPAWINYMTNINQTRGNFAEVNKEMFMTLNRRYETSEEGQPYDVEDLTTYIDPSKFNFIFAETSLDSQNYWAQIAIDMQVRRKLSAKVMPNL